LLSSPSRRWPDADSIAASDPRTTDVSAETSVVRIPGDGPPVRFGERLVRAAVTLIFIAVVQQSLVELADVVLSQA
jgi:hypothetical protein